MVVCAMSNVLRLLSGFLAPYRPHVNGRCRIINVIKDAEIANTQFPNWWAMFKLRNKPFETFTVPRLNARLIGQLLINLVYDSAPLINANCLEVTYCQRGELDRVGHRLSTSVPVRQ